MRRLPVALLLCVACQTGKYWDGGDPDLFSVLVVDAPDAAAYATADDADLRLKRIFSESARYYGYDPTELAGLRLVITGEPVWCGGMWTWGCQNADTNTVSIATRGVPCLEATTITHELLHYFIGDPNHTDPRWRQIGPLFEALRAGAHCD